MVSPDTLQDPSMALEPISNMWKVALKEVEASLNPADVEKLKSIEDHDIFAAKLKTQSEGYQSGSKVYKILKGLDNRFAHIRSFSEAISSMSQYQGSPACLIWGLMFIIIEVSLRFTSILQRIVDMFAEISKAMPRFELYLGLFSTQNHLRDAVKDLYKEFVDFSLFSLKFLKKRPWLNYFELFWKPVQNRFDNTIQRIRHHSSAAESWAQAAGLEAQERREGHAVQRHQELMQTFPNVVITSKLHREVRYFPVHRNPRFFGRQDVISDIQKHLNPRQIPKSEDTLKSYTLHGFGGVGKTQTATEYLYRHLDHFTVLLWFRAESVGALRQEFAEAAKKVGAIPEGQAPDLPASIALFQTWLFETDQKWLIVLDNVEHWDDIKDLWPISTHGSVLITTRSSEVANFTIAKWTLEPYGKTEGLEFLKSLLKDSDDEVRNGVGELAEDIDGHPLALSHAAGYIVTHLTTCTNFLELFKNLQLMRVVNKSSVSLSSIPDYGLTLDNVWTMSLKRLPPLVRDILNITAFLNPDGIQQDILEMSNELFDVVDTNGTAEQGRFMAMRKHQMGEILRSLTHHNLLTRRKAKEYSVHRLLQKALLSRLQEDSTQFHQSFGQASQLIRKRFPAQHVAEPLTPFWTECQETLPHIQNLVQIYSENKMVVEGETFASLLGDAAYYQWERGFLKEALELCSLASSILADSIYDTSVHKADILNVIGAIYIESGVAHIDEGTEIMLQVLKIRKDRLAKTAESSASFEEDYICVSNALSNLACCYIGLRDWDEAYACVDKATKMFERYCSEDSHPYGFAERYANYGQSLAGQGRLDEAIEYVKRATELQRKAFGDDDVRGALFESYWGNFLLQASRTRDAFEKHQAALDIRERKLGIGHNDVAKSLYFVALCQYLLGELDEADIKLDKAAVIYSRMYWCENKAARALFLKSMISAKRGDVLQARELRDNAERLRQDLVGIGPSESDDLGTYNQMVFYH